MRNPIRRQSNNRPFEVFGNWTLDDLADAIARRLGVSADSDSVSTAILAVLQQWLPRSMTEDAEANFVAAVEYARRRVCG